MSPAERGIPLSELAGVLTRTSDIAFSKMNVFHGTFDTIEPGELPKTYAVTLTEVDVGPGPAYISLVRTGSVVTLELECKN